MGNAIYTNRQKAYKKATEKLDKLLTLRLDNEISKEEFQNKKQKLIEEKEKCQEQLDATDERQNRWLELSEKTFNICRYAVYWLANGSKKRKRMLM